MAVPRRRLAAAALALALLGAQAGEPLPVPRVDARRFAGTWYELARLPNAAQRDCQGDVTANYALRRDGSLAVTWRCRRDDGALAVTRGVARPQQGDRSGARLESSFLPRWLRWWPAWNDHWIVALDADYRLAVVGDRSRQRLWVLSRTPHTEPERLQALLRQLHEGGWDTDRLQPTVHRPGPLHRIVQVLT